MPIYEYCCDDCEHVFEEWQKDFEERDMPCPQCSGKSHRLISNTAFILKGSGWYVTDYARGNGGSCASSAGSDNGGNGNGADSKGAESKGSDNGSTGEAKACKSEPASSSETNPAAKESASKPASTGTTAS